MALASDGAVYGVTRYGGSTGNGIIFRYTAAHGVEVVHNFAALNNLSNNPVGGLTLGPDGALYGTVRCMARCCTTIKSAGSMCFAARRRPLPYWEGAAVLRCGVMEDE